MAKRLLTVILVLAIVLAAGCKHPRGEPPPGTNSAMSLLKGAPANPADDLVGVWDVTRPERSRQVRVRRETLVEAVPEVAVGDHGPGAHQIAEALRGLSPTEREAIRLLQVEGLSFEQAAARMGTTPGAAKVRGHRAYQALRRLLGA